MKSLSGEGRGWHEMRIAGCEICGRWWWVFERGGRRSFLAFTVERFGDEVLFVMRTLKIKNVRCFADGN